MFSLAMATGHSLEHKASIADAGKGDFVEHADPVNPDYYRRYARHDSPAASPARVIRAVFESDTSPPLYYVLLYGWTRVLGTSDLALRMFSVVAALACYPLIWSIAKQLGGTRVALAACALYTFSPTAVYYATEGRMYSLLWLFTLCSMATTLRLWRRGTDGKWLIIWVLSAAAGLLTHYFFIFVFAALFGGLLLMPKRASRGMVVAGAVLVGLLVAPWFAQIPATMAHWRVTDYWLKLVPWNFSRLRSSLYLPWSFFSVRGDWGVRPLFDYINAAVFAALALYALIKLNRRLLAPARVMLFGCAIAACVGLVVFDLWRGTYAVNCPRYAHAGFPAAIVLAATLVGALPTIPRRAFLTLIILTSMIGAGRMYRSNYRIHQVQRAAEAVNRWATEDDLVIVSSIPSGVVEVARLIHNSDGADPVMASWVQQLGLRTVPDDILRMARGRKTIILVRIHEVWAEPQHEQWLSKNAKLRKKVNLDAAQVVFYQPISGQRF